MMYDSAGRRKTGKVKWIPGLADRPYRPFWVANGINRMTGVPMVFFVAAETEENLKKEIESEKKRLTNYVFCCFFFLGLTGLNSIKQAENFLREGRDREARDALLDAKVDSYYSGFFGYILCMATMGAFQLALLPFIWVPYLYIKLR